MYNIAFVCVHNSCRSQMAEAITNLKYQEYFNAYSAGTEVKDNINSDAVKTIIKLYNHDMSVNQYSKLTTELKDIDILVTMGCNVVCPSIPAKYTVDFGLDDPSGLSTEVFDLTAKLIDEKINNLVLKIELGQITELL